jgi:hypothetical protein
MSLRAALKKMVVPRLERFLEYRLQDPVSRLSSNVELARTRRATEESARFVDEQMPMALTYSDRYALLDASLKVVAIDGLYCEFGVYKGVTINFIAERTKSEVHGFDSFEGLPEDWNANCPQGTFRVPELPQVRPNVTLHKGWFNVTIPGFAKACTGPIAFLHVDCDLYSSTKTIFEMLGNRLVAGSVIQFDEFFNYPNWRQGEYQAWVEFSEGITFEYLGYVPTAQHVAVKIISRP